MVILVVRYIYSYRIWACGLWESHCQRGASFLAILISTAEQSVMGSHQLTWLTIYIHQNKCTMPL